MSWVSFAGAAIALMLAMATAWAIHRATHNAGWIDTIWTYATGLAAGAAAIGFAVEDISARQALVAALVLVWALRLGTDMTRRTLARPDDPRYAKMAAEWGAEADEKIFWLLQKQAWCGALLILAVFVAAERPEEELRASDILGAIALVISVVGAGLADRQLRLFAADPINRGGVCDVGLWRYSRHPNYFFEWLGWCAYPIIAIDWSGGYLWGWAALAAPALMYWLLVHISGIPPLEEQMIASRGARYERYRNSTNAFFPGPIKKSTDTP